MITWRLRAMQIGGSGEQLVSRTIGWTFLISSSDKSTA
jgi:hypothetical protein